MTTNPSIPIPEAAIEAGAQELANVMTDFACRHISVIAHRGLADHHGIIRLTSDDVIRIVLRAAAPHLLKEAHSAIEHLHNEVGALTEQLNRVTHALHRILSLERAPVSPASAIAREALRALEAPSE